METCVPQAKRRSRPIRPPSDDVVDMFRKLREDEHSVEKISQITGFPPHIIRRSLETEAA